MKDHARIRANRAKKAARNATPRQRKERARRQAMGIALIQRPLRLVLARTSEFNFRYRDARGFADRGIGQGVRFIARQVLRTE